MYPYIFLFLFVSFFYFFDKRFIQNDFIYWLIFLYVLFFSGFRYGVGVDYAAYSDIFFSLSSGFDLDPSVDKLEPMTGFIVRAVNYFGFGEQYFFLLYSFITLFGVFFFIRKFSPDRRVSIFVFICVGIYFFATFNIIRQWLAISFFLMSLVSILSNRYLVSLLFLICMIASHYTSILLLLVYPFLFIRFSFFGALVGLILLFFVAYIAQFFIAGTVYAIYLDNQFLSADLNVIFLLLYVASMLFFLLYFGYFNKRVYIGRELLILLNMCLMSISIVVGMIAVDASSTLMMRVNTYFQVQIIILFSYLFISLKGRLIYYYGKLAFFILIGSYYFYTLLVNGAKYSLTPYSLRFL